MGSIQRVHDIIIVGAGPVGLTTALILHAYGWQPVILERHSTHYPQPRAVGIFHQAVQVYDALGLHNALFANAFYSLSEHTGLSEYVGIEGTVMTTVNFATPMKNGAPRGFSMHQPTLEQVLESACNSRKIPVIRSTEVLNVNDQGNLVQVHASGPEGEYDLSTRFVLGCDGANSIVRRSAGIDFIDSGGIRSRWLVIDVTPNATANSRQWKDAFTGKQYLNPRRPHTSVPSSLFRRRWEFMLLPEGSEEEAKDPKFAWSLLAEFGCSPENANIERSAVYTLIGRWAEGFNKGRLLLAGDAAHTTPPFLGQGLNSGLRDANNIAWRLDFALRNPEKNYQRLFQDFTTEQLGVAKKLVMGAIGLERLFCVLDEEEAKQRDAKLRSAPPPKLPNLEMFDTPGMFIPTVKHGSVIDGPPGHHFVDDVVQIDNAQGRLYEILRFGWVILQAEGTDDEGDAVSEATMKQFNTLLHGTRLTIGERGFQDTKGTIKSFFSDNGIVGVILRPDHYVYATTAEVGALEGLVCGLLQYTEPERPLGTL